MLVSNNRLRLLDFGIARLVGSDEGDATAGYTPGYAAPELVAGQPPNVLSDIYALGVLLREMKSDADPQSTSSDLITIVERATQAHPGERYSSVDALLADIRAVRSNQPISNRRHERGYVLQKYIARNKAIVGGSAVGVIALTVGLIIALWQYQNASVEAQRAKETASFVRSLFERASPEAAGAEDVTLRQLMDDAATRLDRELQTAPDVRHDLMGLIGAGYFGIGDYDKARRLQSQSLTYFKQSKTFPSAEIGIALRAVGVDLQRAGDHVAARQHMQEAARHFFALGMELDGADAVGRYGNMMTNTDPEAAMQAIARERDILARVAPDDRMRKAINLTRLGSAADAFGDHHSAVKHKIAALIIVEKMGKRLNPLFITTRCNLAYSYHLLEDWQPALEVGKNCIDATVERYGGEHPELVPRYTNQGVAWMRQNDPAKAQPFLQQAVELAQRTLPERAYERMAAEANLARSQIGNGQAKRAVPTLASLVERMSASVGANHLSTARMRSLLGRAQFLSGDLASAQTSLAEAALVFDAADKVQPRNAKWTRDMALWLDELNAELSSQP